jgi:diaminohydroxyphosphoribosylaminopyrimidine deaminase/5-amino-6-(5-phosphoribosylamino)uracil reductase
VSIMPERYHRGSRHGERARAWREPRHQMDVPAAYSPLVNDDIRYMRRALALARRGLGRTSPNPIVGSVVIREGRVVGAGWHRRAGESHAEVLALRQAGDRARDATLYTTLEPCAHHGRTPPCVDAIVVAGVRRVVAAIRDPDPRVDGRGIARLRNAGLEVTEGVLAEQARIQNRRFIKHVRMRLPWVLLKMALTLDGRATAPGRRYLTGEHARRYVHRLRDEHDAVVVGIGTVLADDPLLTVREVRGRDPLRVVVDTGAHTPPASRVIGRDGRALIAVAEGADRERIDALRASGAQVIELQRGVGGLDLRALARWLDGRDVTSVLLEGGPTLAGAMIRGGLVDEALFIYAPLLVGAGRSALDGPLAELRLQRVRAFRLGEDVAVQGVVPPD